MTMNNKLAGSILISASGLAAVIGTVGTQIAYALVKAGFYAGNMTGVVPPGPEQVSALWLVIVPVCVIAVLGLYFLFTSDKPG